ncbi:YndM family protein [Fredinandcohnia sp. 179-A 10B2 NHS]|uniref:YndM family protein n=1 Tax=Fredinandcohnia sp. 179-A 10B2 NHS TaxID=3235176 RepID=UPI0039A1C217
MNHLKAIGIKFIITSIVVLSILSIFGDATIGELLFISLLLTGLAYVIGDLFILPRMGNLVATIADFGLAFFSLWALGYLFLERTSALITASLFASVFIALSEALFHAYMENKVFRKNDEKQSSQHLRPSYQTEFAEENEVPSRTQKKK